VTRRILAIAVLASGLAGAALAGGAQAVLPDMGMAKLSTVTIDTTTLPGHRLLRYTADMVNVGQGSLEVRGSRPDTAHQMAVVQRIYNTDNSFTDVPTSIVQRYAGDGHDHWHSLNMEGGALVRLDNGRRVGALAKHGFCFFDNVKFRLTLPGAPATAQYTPTNSCGFGDPSALNVMMGLSVGWGDRYSAANRCCWSG